MPFLHRLTAYSTKMNSIMFRNTVNNKSFQKNLFRGFRGRVFPKKNNEPRLVVWWKEAINYLNRKRVLLRGTMVRIRRVELPIYGEILHLNSTFSYSNLAGHGAFIFLALSYKETDFLNLRLYAASGIFLSIIFQYYREKPLWIPIYWNTLFLAINSFMIFLLWRDSQEAKNIPADFKNLYLKVFQKLGMSPIDFLHLTQKAKKFEFSKGDYLITQGEWNSYLYIIIKGKMSVGRNNKFDYHLSQYQFVGEMSFFSWKDHMDKHEEEEEKNRNLVTNHLIKVSDHQSHSMESNHASSSSDDMEKYGMPGSADVKCDEDCEVYGWSFQDLHEMLLRQPSLAVVFERCLSADLYHKMKEKWSEEPQVRYRLALSTAMVDGEVRDCRQVSYMISSTLHCNLISSFLSIIYSDIFLFRYRRKRGYS